MTHPPTPPTRRVRPDRPPSPDIIARHPDGRFFLLRGRGCVRTPVATFATLDEAKAGSNWSAFPAAQA